jgi:predicted SAM-dependent methyltransferase
MKALAEFTLGMIRHAFWPLRWWKRRKHEHARQARLEAVENARRSRLRNLQQRRDLKLDIGASDRHLVGWITLDIEPDEEGIRMDARQPWPFPDASAYAIRSEHMVEHLTFAEAKICFSEAYRVLIPGGVLRTGTPDLGGIVEAYLDRSPVVLEVHREHGYEAPTWSHFINNYVRMWDHKHIYDFEALEQLLREAGFEQIERAPYGESRHEIVSGTDSHDMGELDGVAMYVDAVKPRTHGS